MFEIGSQRDEYCWKIPCYNFDRLIESMDFNRDYIWKNLDNSLEWLSNSHNPMKSMHSMKFEHKPEHEHLSRIDVVKSVAMRTEHVLFDACVFISQPPQIVQLDQLNNNANDERRSRTRTTAGMKVRTRPQTNDGTIFFSIIITMPSSSIFLEANAANSIRIVNRSIIAEYVLYLFLYSPSIVRFIRINLPIIALRPLWFNNQICARKSEEKCTRPTSSAWLIVFAQIPSGRSLYFFVSCVRAHQERRLASTASASAFARVHF